MYMLLHLWHNLAYWFYLFRVNRNIIVTLETYGADFIAFSGLMLFFILYLLITYKLNLWPFTN